MTRYHINHEGKIYPCRAKVLKCPYSESLHSNDKIELYYKLMSSREAEVEPSKNAMGEMRELNRLKSLYSMSKEIENSESPVELITHTLKESLGKLVNHDMAEDARRWDLYIEKEAEDVYDVLNTGYQVPNNIPIEIADRARDKFHDRRGGVPQQYAKSSRKEELIVQRRNLAKRDYKNFNHYKKWKLNANNYDGTYKWMTRDFEKFSHDLNTSRMITQPIFYGDLEKTREQIKQMDDYELLATFDDYSVTDKEIEENVKEANHFKYTDRKDLSDEANKKISEWYKLNKKIYQNWKINTPKRVLISMEIAEELDRRGAFRQDSAITKMFDEEREE